tara:strand:+ start:1045 stop:2343 length:1299 start_codon:yes stop_codon:yes gene_type:complete
MNEYDSNRIYDLVSTIGFNKTNIKKEADCFLLNTCHIREKSTEKVYDEIGRVKKDFKNLKKPLVIITGCVAQAESNEMINREPYIDMVIGPQSYHKIRDLILNHERKKKKINETEFDVVKKFDELQKINNSQNKISSYITIQEGCDKFCNFCVVPYTRGPEHSRSFKQIVEETNYLVENGAREIILLGQNVNAYNFVEKKKNYKLSSLIQELNKIKNLKRIRFLTSHPKDMTEDLINCYENCEKLMPLLHLPIQSGSDRMLRLMNRKHNSEYYLSIIKKLKNINEEIKISSDFIVGYPGETEKDFKETIELIKRVGFVNSYSFIFSPRPGTPAGEKKLNNLTENKNRLKKLQKLLNNLQFENNKRYLDKNSEVLIENKLDNQVQFFGRNKYMIPVIFESDNCKVGDLIDIRIKSFSQKSLFGSHKINKVRVA